MKHSKAVVFLYLFSAPFFANAQQNESVRTYQSGVEYRNNQSTQRDAPKPPGFLVIAKAVEQAKAEVAELSECNRSNPCEQAKFDEQMANANFILRHYDEIRQLGADFVNAFHNLARLLRSDEAGTVNGTQNAIVEFDGRDDFGRQTTDYVMVKDLFAFIEKYEADAQNADTDQKLIDLQTQYEDSSNLKSADYFHLTLSRAKSAFSHLNRFLHFSQNDIQKFTFAIVEGKHPFKITTIFKPSRDRYKSKVDSELLPVGQNTELVVFHNMVEILNAPDEDQFWKVVAENHITLDGIPIDGAERRVYYHNKFSDKPCGTTTHLIVSANTPPSPNVPFEQVVQDDCPSVIKIISATMYRHAFIYSDGSIGDGMGHTVSGYLEEITAHENFVVYGDLNKIWNNQGDWANIHIARLTPVINVTEHMKKIFDNTHGYGTGTSSVEEFSELNSYLSGGWLGDTILDVTYECHCNVKHMISHYKTDGSITLPDCH